MALQRQCSQCGESFTTTPSQNQRYCSRRCGWDAQKGRPHTRRVNKVERSCIQCGATFWRHASEVAAGRGKFCSNACASRSRLGERRGDGPRSKISTSIRNHVIARDKVCVACGLWDGRPKQMQVHHLRYGGEFDLSKLILLCLRCHREWHRQEGTGPKVRPRPHSAALLLAAGY